MISDAELLRRYADEKSEAAFGELVERHLNLVYFAALRQVGDPHLAKDVVQSVFTDLARKAAKLSRRPVIASWLYTSTRFAATKARRGEQRRQHYEQEAETMHALLCDEAAAAEWERLRPLIDDVVYELKDDDREAVLLRFFENQPFASVGEALGVSEDAARMRVDRALEKLGTFLARRGITSSSTAIGTILSSQAGLAAPTGLSTQITGVALASTAGTGAYLLTFFHIMNTTKMTAGAMALIGITSIVALVSIGTGAYAWRQSNRDREALTSAHEHYAADQARLKALLQSAQEAEQALAALQTSPSVPKSAARPADGKIEATPADWQRFQAAYPEARAMLRDIGKAQIDRNYQIFFEQAKLTPAQIEEFERRTLDLLDQNVTITPDGSIRPAVNQLPDDQLRAIMGEENFQKLQAYTLMGPANGMAGRIAVSVGSAGAPMSSDKQLQLAEIIANNSPSFQNGERMNLMTVDWTTAAAQAKEVLSPAQWRVAQGALLNFQFQIAMSQTMRSQAAPVTETKGK